MQYSELSCQTGRARYAAGWRRLASVGVTAVALCGTYQAVAQAQTQYWLQRSSTGAAGVLAPDPSVPLPVNGTAAPAMVNSVVFDRDHMYYSIGTSAIYVADAASNYIRSYTMFSMGGQAGVAPDGNVGTNPAVFNRWNANAGRDAAYTSSSALGPKHLGNGQISDELYMFFTGFDRRTIYAVKSGSTLTGEYVGTVISGDNLSALTVDQNTGLLYATGLSSGLNEANSRFFVYDPSGIGSDLSRTIVAGRILPTDGSPPATSLASDVTIDADGNVYVIGRTGGNAAFPAGRYLYKVIPGKTDGVLNSNGSGWTYSTTLRITAGTGTAAPCGSYPTSASTSVYGMGFLNGTLYSAENNCLYSTNVFTGVTNPLGRISYSASFDTNPPLNSNVNGARVPATGTVYDMAIAQVASAVAGTIYNDTTGVANIVPGTTPGLAGVAVELYQLLDNGSVVMQGRAVTGDAGQFSWLTPGNSTFYVRAVQPANNMFMTWAAGTADQGSGVNNPVTAYCYNAAGGAMDSSGFCYGVRQAGVDAPAGSVGQTYASEADFLAAVRYASKVVLQSTNANTVPQASMAFSTAPRLSIVKSGPESIAAGTPFDYSFAVRNDNGPAFDFYLADKPPAGITLNAAPSGAAAGSCTVNGSAISFPLVGNGNTVVVCRIVLTPALSAGGTATVTWSATAAASAAGTLPVNYASYNPSGAPNPPVPGVNCTSAAFCTQTTASNPVQPAAASLSMVKSAPAIASNVPFDYSFAISNSAAAGGAATVVHIADLPPIGITLNAAPSGASASNCTVGGAAAVFPVVGNGSRVVVCAIPLAPALEPGQSRTVAWNATASGATVGSQPVNHASYNPDGSQNPPAPGANCTPAARCSSGQPSEPVVEGMPALTVLKSAPAIAVNTPFNYSFVIANEASAAGAATLVHIADLPPEGITLNAPPSGATADSCTVNGAAAVFPVVGDGSTVVVCAIALAPAVLPGETQTLLWPATADPSTAGEQPVNHASYNPDGSANPPAPGEACAPAARCTSGAPAEPVSEGAPELSVVKTAPPIAANTAFNYAFEVRNAASAAGPATVLHIADMPPAGITLNAPPSGAIARSCRVAGAAVVFPVVGDGAAVVACAISLTPALQPDGVRMITWSATADDSVIGDTPVNHASYRPDGGENPPTPGQTCTPAANCTSGAPNQPVTAGAPLLSVVKTAPEIAANSAFNYLFTVSNDASAAGSASVVHIADLPPAGITLNAAPAGSSCTVAGAAAQFPFEGNGTDVVECAIALAPAVQPGEERILAWNATAAGTSIGSTPVNHASYNPDGSASPPTPGENCTSAASCTSAAPAVPVTAGPPSLSVVKTAPAIAANTAFNYRFAVRNAADAVGPAALVHIADLPPTGITLNAAPLGSSCTINGIEAVFPVVGDGATIVECAIALTPALQAGEEAVVLWSATAAGTTVGSTPVNHASYNADGSANPPAPGATCAPAANCTSGAPDGPVVPGAPTLTVVKSASAMTANTPFHYHFAVSNAADAAGPASLLHIADQPPVGITLNAAPSGASAGSCTVDGAAAVFPVVGNGATVVECAIALSPALVPGRHRTVTWIAAADASTIDAYPVNHASYNPDGSANPPAPGVGCTPAARCTSGAPAEPVSEGPPTLTVAKNAPAISANTAFNYQFVVANAADAAGSASLLHIADKPPVGITLNAAPSGASASSCTVGGDDAVFPVVGDGMAVVECAIALTPALEQGEVRTVTWNATADDSTIGALPVNHASYNADGSAGTPEPGAECAPAASCTSGAPADPVTAGAPSLTVVVTAPNASANSPFNYSFEVSNDPGALGAAVVVHLADKPPAGITLNAEPSGAVVGSCTVDGAPAVFPIVGDGSKVVVCAVELSPALQPGESRTVTWNATADDSTIGEQPVNHASYNPDGSANPPVPGATCTPEANCTSGAPVDPISAGAPSLTVVVTAPNASANSPFNYSFEVSNDPDALGAAVVVYLADKPPAGIKLNAEPSGAVVGSCTVDGAPAVFPIVGDGSKVVVCAVELSPALQPGESRTVTWNATADDSTIGEQPVNHASYNPDGSANPPVPGATCTPAANCTSGAPADPISAGAPSLTVVVTAPNTSANSPFNYSFEVSNDPDALGAAAVVYLADKPPAGITLNAEPSGAVVGSCTVDGAPALFPIVGDGNKVVVCAVELSPALQPGESRTVTWNATADDSTIGEQPVNHASYNTDGSANPPVPGATCTPAANCTSGAPADPISAGAPSLTVVVTAPNASANSPFNYRFEVSNDPDALGAATVVYLADKPPAGITLNAEPSGAVVGSCTVDGAPAVFPIVGDGSKVVVCAVELSPALQPGESRTVTWNATADDSTIGDQPVNHASYNTDGSANPPVPGATCTPEANCTSGAPADPISAGAPSLTVVVTAPSVTANSPFNYSFEVSNDPNALGAASVVHIAGKPPAGITLNAEPSGAIVGSCTVDGAPAVFPIVGDGSKVVVCAVALSPALQPGESRTVTWNATADDSTIGTSPVHHVSFNTDGSANPPVPGETCTPAANCTSGAPTELVAAGMPLLTVVKSAPAITANALFDYRFAVANDAGAVGAARVVHIADKPPVGITLTAEPSGAVAGSCTIDGAAASFPVVGNGSRFVVCPVVLAPALAPGQSTLVAWPATADVSTIGSQPVNHASYNQDGSSNPPEPGQACTVAGSCTSGTPEEPVARAPLQPAAAIPVPLLEERALLVLFVLMLVMAGGVFHTQTRRGRHPR